MSQHPPPDRPALPFNWTEPPDRLNNPEFFEGLIARRVVGYLIDAVILGGIIFFLWMLVVVTLGMLALPVFLLMPLLPLAYHGLQIAGPNAATIGMRVMGVEVRRLDGGRPDLVQAFLQTAMFYITAAPMGGLLLLAAFFNDRGRCLHDWLSGTIVLRSDMLSQGSS